MVKVGMALVLLSVGILAGQSPRPLTRTQVEQLVGVLPDKALAGEIRQRGIDFRVDPLALERFKEMGAGAETIASLSELLSNAQLAITSAPPNCEVSLNGHVIRTTDDNGKLIIHELDAGRSEVRISKVGYTSRSYFVDLIHNRTTELHAVLESVAGYLSVSTIPPDASVTVRLKDRELEADSAGLCSASQSSRNLWKCVPGEYIISAFRRGFLPASETARVTVGQMTRLLLTLPRQSPVPNTPPAIPSNRLGGIGRTKDAGALQLLAMVQVAMGGKENLAAVRDWKREAREIWQPAKGTTESTTMFVAPSSLREEFKGGNKTADYSNGRTGWTWSSSRRVTRELPMATATGMVFRTLNTLMLSDNDPECGVNLTAPGTLVFTDRYHNRATLTADLSRYLPRSLSWRNLDGAVLEETYSDWRKVAGVMWWFHMTRSRDGQTFLEVQVKNYHVNKGLTDKKLSSSPGHTDFLHESIGLVR